MRHNYDSLIIHCNLSSSSSSSFLIGIVQYINYLRPIQLIAHVGILNERLNHLDDKILKIVKQTKKYDEKYLNFEASLSSTVLFETIEVYREVYGRIWSMHETLSHCFGASIFIILLNGCLSGGITMYFSVVWSNHAIFSLENFTTPMLHSFHIISIFMILIQTCEESQNIVS